MKELIQKIKDIMIEVSTGKARIEDKNPEYQEIYSLLSSEYNNIHKVNPNQFSDLWEFHQYWKENLPQYSDRRAYVIKLYKDPIDLKPSTIDFWELIHPLIKSISKSRFDSEHYADSVESAMKEVNVRVKTIVKNITGNEDDGSSLMKKAFSVNNPVIRLDDTSNETGRNI